MLAKSLVVLCPLVALLVGCHRASTPASTPVPLAAPPASAASAEPVSSAQPTVSAADHLDVLEVVFRHQLSTNYSGSLQDADVYLFLSLDGSADPPPELMLRFAQTKPSVLPVSLAEVSLREGVRHGKLGGRGVIFRVTAVAWLDEITAEVEGGYNAGIRAASGNTYRVSRASGSWKVTSDRTNSFS